MDARFLTLTGLLSAAAFGGVWFVTAPAASGVASAAIDTDSTKSKKHFVVEAPPQDTEPEPLYEDDEPRRTYSGTASSGVYYSGCNAVRAAGAAPLHRGEPGYRPEMDGDNDGIACEPHRY